MWLESQKEKRRKTEQKQYETYPQLKKSIQTQIQEALQSPSKTNKKKITMWHKEIYDLAHHGKTNQGQIGRKNIKSNNKKKYLKEWQ